jgi:hypothetical protein
MGAILINVGAILLNVGASSDFAVGRFDFHSNQTPYGLF